MFLDVTLKRYKAGILLSTLVLLVALAVIGYSYATKGEIVQKGLDFTGGSQIVLTVESVAEKTALTEAIEALGTDVSVKFSEGNNPAIIINSKEELPIEEVQRIVEETTPVKESSYRQLGAALGEQFLKDAYLAIVVAFAVMSLVVFFTFKTPVPSLAVILAGASDIVVTVALMNIFSIELTLATLTAILTLIGFVVDIDILLSTRVLKRRSIGTLDERIKDSFKTGITMTGCAIVAMLVLFFVSTSPELDSIALVILFGLVADIPFAWLQNVGILKIYCKKKGIA